MSNGTHIVRDPKGQVDEVSRSGGARELAFEDAMGSYFYAENNVVYRQVFLAFKEEYILQGTKIKGPEKFWFWHSRDLLILYHYLDFF